MRHDRNVSRGFAIGLSAALLVISLLWRLAHVSHVPEQYDPPAGNRPRPALLDAPGHLAAWVIALVVFVVASPGSFPASVTVAARDVTVTRAIFTLAVIAVAAVYVSSLVDQFYVTPRMSGDQWGQRPCRSYDQGRSWKGVTRIWLLHRLLSYLMVVACGAVLIALVLNHWLKTGVGQVTIGAIGATATVLAGFYLTRAASVIAFIQNPVIYVGDTVQLAEEYPSPHSTRRYYVMDVAVEGLKLADVTTPQRHSRHGSDSSSASGDTHHDRVLDINDVSRLLRRRLMTKPCTATSCSGLNTYCPLKGRLQATSGDDIARREGSKLTSLGCLLLLWAVVRHGASRGPGPSQRTKGSN